MTSAILLSSSPPRPWARSPTVIDIPSSPSSSQNPSLRYKPSVRRFRTTSANRDGFAASPGPQSLLQVRSGAENIPVRSPRKPRTYLSPDILVESADHLKSDGMHVSEHSTSINATKFVTKGIKAGRKQLSFGTTPHAEHIYDPIEHDDVDLSEIPSAQQPRLSATPPGDGGFTVYRRLDWTPVKNAKLVETHSSTTSTQSAAFPHGLMTDFAYHSAENLLEVGIDSQNLPKRRRLNANQPCFQTSRPDQIDNKDNAAVTHIPGVKTKEKAKRRSKSPTKKPLTITSLATAHYFGDDVQKDASPMMDFLSSTQARVRDSLDATETKPTSKTKPQKGGKTRRVMKAKSRLLSPTSAMQALNDQDLIFGSASQLVVDGRFVVAMQTTALQQPPTSPFKSDVVSTQESFPVSGPNTPGPKQGLARYSHRRNLWAAAGRDEDNALLHMDAVDLSEESNIRLALAGKDVLVQPDRQGLFASGSGDAIHNTKLDVAEKPRKTHQQATIYDIDNLESPAKMSKSVCNSYAQQWQVHTSSKMPGKERDTNPEADKQHQDSVSRPRAPAIEKPSLAGLTLQELRKRIASYGFKAVKGRENMISLLERCWDEKHKNPHDEVVEAPHESTTHGDFLSKVHDISSRPTPKLKKPKAKPKEKSVTRKAPKAPKAKRQPKSTNKTDAESVRKRKPKAVVPHVSEPDQDLQTAPNEVLSPPKQPAEKAKAGADPPISYDTIRRAVMHQSLHSYQQEHDHKRSPTWHEKILMYDPIVLEDLTTWLNTYGFAAISEDNEVSAHDVRAWCEKEGICCLWRGGWRGQRDKNTED